MHASSSRKPQKREEPGKLIIIMQCLAILLLGFAVWLSLFLSYTSFLLLYKQISCPAEEGGKEEWKAGILFSSFSCSISPGKTQIDPQIR